MICRNNHERELESLWREKDEVFLQGIWLIESNHKDFPRMGAFYFDSGELTLPKSYSK